MLIQCLWRCYAADKNFHSEATWKIYMQNNGYENGNSGLPTQLGKVCALVYSWLSFRSMLYLHNTTAFLLIHFDFCTWEWMQTYCRNAFIVIEVYKYSNLSSFLLTFITTEHIFLLLALFHSSPFPCMTHIWHSMQALAQLYWHIGAINAQHRNLYFPFLLFNRNFFHEEEEEVKLLPRTHSLAFYAPQ